MDPVPPVEGPPAGSARPAGPAAVPPAPAMTPPARYAGFWLRWVALVIDGFLLSLPMGFLCVFGMLALGLSMGGAEHGPNPIQVLFFVFVIFVGFVANWLYHAFMESSAQQATLGKRVLGLKVTDEEGRRISFGRASGRHWGKILSGLIFNIGYIMAAFTERKQALHDMLAKTLVVRSAA